MKSKTAQINTQKLFWIFSITLFVLFMTYAYMVNAAIMGAVNRQKVQVNITKLASQTSNLETEYIALKNSINLELAYTLGFKNESNTRFVARKDAPGNLTLR